MALGKLLVVEDNLEVAGLICNIAEKNGFKAQHALKNYRDTYQRILPDIVVLDIMMPDEDGFEVLKYLGQQNSPAAIVLVSANDNFLRGMAERWGRALGLSIIANLEKPFFLSELEKTLRLYRAKMQEGVAQMARELSLIEEAKA